LSLYTYLKRYTRYPQQIQARPAADTNLIVTIPCFNEPDPFTTLESLWVAERPQKPAEVLIIINQSDEHTPEEVKAYHEDLYKKLLEWCRHHQDVQLRFYTLHFKSIRSKILGVGTARKLGMDEAAYRFYSLGHEQGIMVNLDADCTVESNYFKAIEDHFKAKNTQACSIYFEHPLSGDHPEAIYRAIMDFELYLRYFKNAFLWTGFPYAYHTIGSVMANTCKVYHKIGGMNKQKAGEDFYFVQKLAYQGHFSELNTTRVIPSPRKSLRVPFGTGQAVTDYVEDALDSLDVFNSQNFVAFQQFIERVPDLYKLDPDHSYSFLESLPSSVSTYLTKNDFKYYLVECQENAKNQAVFVKRFYHWFNAFQALQYLHHTRDHYYPNVPVEEAARWLCDQLGLRFKSDQKLELLYTLRHFDRYGNTARPQLQLCDI